MAMLEASMGLPPEIMRLAEAAGAAHGMARSAVHAAGPSNLSATVHAAAVAPSSNQMLANVQAAAAAATCMPRSAVHLATPPTRTAPALVDAPDGAQSHANMQAAIGTVRSAGRTPAAADYLAAGGAGDQQRAAPSAAAAAAIYTASVRTAEQQGAPSISTLVAANYPVAGGQQVAAPNAARLAAKPASGRPGGHQAAAPARARPTANHPATSGTGGQQAASSSATAADKPSILVRNHRLV
jgi:hypothetical protein